MSEKLTGQLKYWNEPRGFGFVNYVVDGNLRRYFLHVSQIIDGDPIIGSTVEFHGVQDTKGFVAQSAEIISNEYALKLAEAVQKGDGAGGK